MTHAGRAGFGKDMNLGNGLVIATMVTTRNHSRLETARFITQTHSVAAFTDQRRRDEPLYPDSRPAHSDTDRALCGHAVPVMD